MVSNPSTGDDGEFIAMRGAADCDCEVMNRYAV